MSLVWWLGLDVILTYSGEQVLGRPQWNVLPGKVKM